MFLVAGEKYVIFFPRKTCCVAIIIFLQFVSNKAKERISTWVLQENKARQIFQKTNFSYSLIRNTHRFEIRPFTLLPKNCCLKSAWKFSFSCCFRLNKSKLHYFSIWSDLIWPDMRNWQKTPWQPWENFLHWFSCELLFQCCRLYSQIFAWVSTKTTDDLKLSW